MSERIWMAAGVLVITLGGAATLLSLGALPAIVVIGAASFGVVAIVVLELVLRPPPADPEPRDRTRPAGGIGFGRALLGRMPVPFLVIDDRRVISYANPAAQTLLPRLQVGQHISTQLRAPQVLEIVNEVSRDGKERATTFAMISGPEQRFVARIAALPPGGDFGPLARVMIQLEDHTDQHRAMSMRSDFIANASHELRTPLASIIGYIETLQGHAKDDPEAQTHFLGIMARQAHRMQRLIEDLMWLSRIELSEHLRPEDTCDLTEIAREACATVEPLAKQYGAKLSSTLGDDPQRVIGDRDQITQVLVNLLDNAMKYGGDGVEVSLSMRTQDLRFPGQVGVCVEDNGPGIARSEIPRLTERFYRIAPQSGPQKDGTGLGLAIAKHILNRHAGELDIWSEPGQGSRFTIWLPSEPEAADESDKVVKLFENQ